MSRFAEYSYVSLKHDVRVGDTEYKAGTRGVVVHRHADGIGYEVEFERPHFGVLTLMTADLDAARFGKSTHEKYATIS